MFFTIRFPLFLLYSKAISMPKGIFLDKVLISKEDIQK